MRKCKRCNGTGRVLENVKGDSGTVKFSGISMNTGKNNSCKGTVCLRCNGRGEI